MMRLYFDSDCDAALVQNMTVAVIGYGSQGHAHAANLADAGVKRVIVGLKEQSASRPKASAAGFEIMTAGEAARFADLIVLLAPDEVQPEIYEQELAQSMKTGACLVFAHGLNIHFSMIEVRQDLDVILVAPKGPGHQLRARYKKGDGLACLIATHQDSSGHAFSYALSYASLIGSGRVGILETTFKEECETDLFGEQAVLCGGIPELIQTGFEVLVEAGYSPEMAYFECVHEAKLITDLIFEVGLDGMRGAISNTAEFGGYRSGPRIINAETKKRMVEVLNDIRSGSFARDFVLDQKSGGSHMAQGRKISKEHAIEKIGNSLRSQMPMLTGSERLIKD